MHSGLMELKLLGYPGVMELSSSFVSFLIYIDLLHLFSLNMYFFSVLPDFEVTNLMLGIQINKALLV